MNAIRMAAIGLIVAGILALVYGGFTYTKETHQAKLGPIDISVKDKETVNIPIWAGIGAIVIGGVAVEFWTRGAYSTDDIDLYLPHGPAVDERRHHRHRFPRFHPRVRRVSRPQIRPLHQQRFLRPNISAASRLPTSPGSRGSIAASCF